VRQIDRGAIRVADRDSQCPRAASFEALLFFVLFLFLFFVAYLYLKRFVAYLRKVSREPACHGVGSSISSAVIRSVQVLRSERACVTLIEADPSAPL
jgi:hypothetical protein